jgi:hypothetical protein
VHAEAGDGRVEVQCPFPKLAAFNLVASRTVDMRLGPRHPLRFLHGQKLPSTAYGCMSGTGKIFARSSNYSSSLAAAGDILRQYGKQQAERGVAENNLAGDDDLTEQRRRSHIAKT